VAYFAYLRTRDHVDMTGLESFVLGRIEAEEPWIPSKTSFVIEAQFGGADTRGTGGEEEGGGHRAEGSDGRTGNKETNDRLAAIEKAMQSGLRDIADEMAKEVQLLKRQIAEASS
jgi:hypothetical protein